VSGEPVGRNTARVRALRWFRKRESTLLALLAAVVVALTFAGYALDPRVRTNTTLPQAIYDSLKSVAGGVDWNTYGWQGDVANWLDLALIMWVAAKAVLFAFASGADVVRARRRRGHTVLCGLGERGRVMGEALLGSGEKLTIIDSAVANPNTGLLRAQGACVITGDATDDRALLTARVDRAERVVCLLPTDDQNAFVAHRIAQLLGSGAPTCFVHNHSPSTWSSILDSTNGTVIPFSALDSSCSDVFLALDLESASGPVDLVVFGTSSATESIVMRAAKVWQAIVLRDRRPDTLRIRIVGIGATRLASHVLPLRYSGIDRLCEIVAEDVDSYEVAEHLAVCSGADSRNLFAVMAATEDDEANVRLTLALARCLPVGVRIVAVNRLPSGILELLSSDDLELAARLAVVDVNGALGDPATILGGTREALARLAHEDWLRSQRRNGHTLRPSGPMQHWERLSEEFKASNRDQAGGVFDRMIPFLRSSVVPLAEWDPEPFEFRAGEIEGLARLEHERWCAERARSGWRLDAALTERDPDRKMTPWLVPYDALPESQKDNDRDAASRVPVTLARAGFRIRRGGTT
jgi:hypothetical protein